ncbi:MAG: calcium/sodium antiporter [Acidimicrobiia bacterium]
MSLFIVAVVVGLVVLLWGADRFIEGSASVARHFGMPPLLIGMVVVGFGTSAPELVVSLIAALQGNPGVALGNAIGSNIANIALILGVTAVISPIAVHSKALRSEFPLLLGATALATWVLWDLGLTRGEAVVLLVVFAGIMGWTIWRGLTARTDALAREIDDELSARPMPIRSALLWLAVGLVALVASSRALVWGATGIAEQLGVADLVVGLTVVALGTSLPELASSVIAARRNEHDIALGNVLGSNLFNTLAVLGTAGVVSPIDGAPTSLPRDLAVMAAVTVLLFAMGFGFRREGRITRGEGVGLVGVFVVYTGWLVLEVVG